MEALVSRSTVFGLVVGALCATMSDAFAISISEAYASVSLSPPTTRLPKNHGRHRMSHATINVTMAMVTCRGLPDSGEGECGVGWSFCPLIIGVGGPCNAQTAEVQPPATSAQT